MAQMAEPTTGSGMTEKREAKDGDPAQAEIASLRRRIADMEEDHAQRLAAEDALRRERDFAESLVETAQVIVLVLDTQGKIVRINPFMEELCGYRQDDVRGKDWFTTFLPKDDQDKIREVFLQAVHDIHTRGNVNPIVTRDGGLRYIEWYDRTLKDRSGRVTGLLSLGMDITERREAEQELVRHRDHLEELVKARTAALELSNRDLEQFAYVASHDLQEPLRKILSFGELLEKAQDGLTDDSRDYLQRMRGATRRMVNLVEDLLKLSRLSSRAEPFAPVNLGTAMQEVLTDLEPLIRETGARIEVGNLPVIDAESTHMRRLLQNLIANALKFRRPGVEPVVKVTSRAAKRAAGEGEARQILLVVQDNGIGFEEQQGERIFGIFQRLHARGEVEGTGIGLAVCRRIAEFHGGRIEAFGRPGRGAKFVVTLPVKQHAPVPDTPPESGSRQSPFSGA